MKMKVIDFGIGWGTTIKEDFVKFLQKYCCDRKLSFILIHDGNYKKILKGLESHNLLISVLLDTEATYHLKGDPYSRMSYAVKDAGGVVINDPDRTRSAIDKSITHFELIHAKINTPYTVVIRNWEPLNFKLTDSERNNLGVPFIIKPALGYGQQGVIRDARGSIREIALARNFDRGDNFLIQEKIVPIHLNNKRAWFRVFNVFDTIIPCWWDDQQNHYQHVTYEEFNQYSLFPLAKIVAKISTLTRMVWFSTEIAIDKKYGTPRFLAIDYVNDQCDMSTMSETKSGLPDDIVEHVARIIIDNTERLINNRKPSKKYTIWFDDAKIILKGLGQPRDLLMTKRPFPKKTYLGKGLSIKRH